MIPKPKKTKNKRKALINKLDVAWSLKARAGCQCELCNSKGHISDFDAHHIKRRGNQSTRWLIESWDNGSWEFKTLKAAKIFAEIELKKERVKRFI